MTAGLAPSSKTLNYMGVSLITENRAKALEALRTLEESERCSGTIMYTSKNGENRMCALGAIGIGLGFMQRGDDIWNRQKYNDDWYARIGEALEYSPSIIYKLNDDRFPGDGFKYTWPEIADILEERWAND